MTKKNARVRKKRKKEKRNTSSLPSLPLPTGRNEPRLEPRMYKDCKPSGDPKELKKKKRRRPKFSDQLGVKVSWSTWQWRQGQEKFHKETIRRASSYVGRQIREHQNKLEKLNSIFDPKKMKDLQRAFQQKMIDRDNLGMLKRLSMIATEKTMISKTNDPYERRYINKLRRDKARMMQNTKQYELNMVNFDNKLMLKRLRKTRTSLQSRKGLKRDFKRSRVMKKAMSKVFDPKFQKQNLIERGLYNPVARNTPLRKKKKKFRSRKSNHIYGGHKPHQMNDSVENTQPKINDSKYFDSLGNAVDPASFEEIDGPNPFTPESQPGYASGAFMLENEISNAESYEAMGQNSMPFSEFSSRGGLTPPLIGTTPPIQGTGHTDLGKPPLTPLSRGSIATTPFSVGSAAPKSAASSVPSKVSFANPKNLLMKQQGMRIGQNGVLISAYRGPNEALVYEITDPTSGIVAYYDIPPNVIYEIGIEFPALLEMKQGSRIAKLATLLDIKKYFNSPKNITAKMYWWHKQKN